MKIPVLIERIAANGYRARSGEPFVLTAEGATRDDALNNLRRLMDAKLHNGAELAEVSVGEQENPWLSPVGFLPANDPLVDEWIETMKENRRKLDEEPDPT
jgi:hypothetical protein